MVRIKRALLSVSDKAGLVEFATGLHELGIELISTGGTAKTLSDAGLPIQNVSDITHFPEMLDGRVKTLHPAVHGALLAVRSLPEHMETIAAHGITPIDLVVVNLYPFAETIAKPGVTREEAIENIDIGGPSMIRSAAKNHVSVAVVVSPDDYPALLSELQKNDGALSQATRSRLAVQAYAHTAAYDATITKYLAEQPLSEETETQEGQGFPNLLTLSFSKVQDLRYGENPHQKAAFYREPASTGGIAAATKLHGKELSFNNIYDLNAAYNLVLEFADQSTPAAAIIKHTNPCGAAIAGTLSEAFQKAREGDPISAFGGILAVNRTIDAETANLITGKNTFFEAIIAPGYDPEAFTILTTKKQWCQNLILLQAPEMTAPSATEYDYKRVSGGLLVQTQDTAMLKRSETEAVSERQATPEEMSDLMLAWKLVKHVKSNAIVLVKDRQLIGVGAGQMNRVQSVRLAVAQAGEKAKGAVLASDAFFPFPDGPEAALQAGVTAIIQPGGSKKDDESTAMADQYGAAMVLTGRRHFRH
ncbi:MAG: bifunctional phosphoribosylaminoimidazolecarboxamide formyltransferase/IMP cyclohydrolase [Janthinobacterium lividum]